MQSILSTKAVYKHSNKRTSRAECSEHHKPLVRLSTVCESRELTGRFVSRSLPCLLNAGITPTLAVLEFERTLATSSACKRTCSVPHRPRTSLYLCWSESALCPFQVLTR